MRKSVSSLLLLIVCSVSYAKDLEIAPEPINVIASFSILADWVEVIGASEVNVQSLVKKDEDVHVYKATPQDMAQLSKADLLVVNGMNLEGWMGRIINASGYTGDMLVASRGIDVLNAGATDHDHHNKAHGHGKAEEKESQRLLDRASMSQRSIMSRSGYVDPHAWTSLREARVYVSNIAAALSQLRPEHADLFESRKADYLSKLDALDQRAQDAFSVVPKERRNIVIPHNAFNYLARDYGFSVHSLSGLSTRSESSAQRVAMIVRAIRKANITAIFSENISNTKLIYQVQNETSVKVSGTLISGALSEEKAPSYLKMMEYNLELLSDAMGATFRK